MSVLSLFKMSEDCSKNCSVLFLLANISFQLFSKIARFYFVLGFTTNP